MLRAFALLGSFVAAYGACAEEEASTASLDHAGLGFTLVVIAGLSTAIGAAAVYVQRLVQITSKAVLAAGLGFSGGVMIYVSFVEIFVKSQDAFAEEMEEKEAYWWATFCLFCGMVLLRLISMLVHKIDKDHDHCGKDSGHSGDQLNMHVPPTASFRGEELAGPAQTEAVDAEKEVGEEPVAPIGVDNVDVEKKAPSIPISAQSLGDKKLQRMGLNTAAAVAIHNFPEGLATFVATLADPSVGVTLAVAIAIHNIPEGICVALPIYYSTGSRHKGFIWALFSGLSEPVGAFIGWAIIKSSGDDMNQLVYGVLFGIVAGMMIMIVLLELLPTGYRYDPRDKYVTNSLCFGMVVMALSLVLFAL